MRRGKSKCEPTFGCLVVGVGSLLFLRRIAKRLGRKLYCRLFHVCQFILCSVVIGLPLTHILCELHSLIPQFWAVSEPFVLFVLVKCSKKNLARSGFSTLKRQGIKSFGVWQKSLKFPVKDTPLPR